MALNKIETIQGTIIPILGDDIDTDRIIPARFLKCVTFDGLGEFAFYDERFGKNKEILNHPMDQKEYKEGNILLSNNNFGCGSSREHAPQAIRRAGIDCVIAESFAEIFFGNSITLGLVCVTLSHNDIMSIYEEVKKNPQIIIQVDVKTGMIKVDNKSYKGLIPEGAKKAFLTARYDSLSELLAGMDKVKKLERNLPYSF